MDERAGKRAVVHGKGTGLVLKDRVNSGERNARFCNRIGCSGRLNSMNGITNGKAKSSSIGSSSGVYPAVRKSSTRKRVSSQLETSSVLDVPQVLRRTPQPESGDAESREVRRSSVASNARPSRNVIQRSPIASLGLVTSTNTSRHGLRNLRCNSISGVGSSGGSSSNLNVRRREDAVKKRNSDGEGSSSCRGKKSSESTLKGRNNSSSHNVYVSADSRQAGTRRDSGVASSVRTRGSNSTYGRGRSPNQANGNMLTLNECHAIMPEEPQSDMPINVNEPVPEEIASTHTSSYSQLDNISESLLSIMPSGPSEVDSNHTSGNWDSFRQYNMDNLAEVLLALERIEQDEELTYEQLLVLETSLLLDGLNFYDQHREMRLDIDNMSYEELLDLEEKIGNVSTVLSEEALSKCLTKSIYEDDSLSCYGEKDDTKCSICQEEYVNGDEVGKLRCEHRYHAACVLHWLQVKNWCPICKGSPQN
ncbi:JAV1- 37 ASSOCIATED UBIQUITIN LIGASE 1 [Hibiscus trionum]|uniref:RING-type E3 ubiquitin transferase n=1 Tax=Hibiscus trionum TaxID=183268 RepID=A0A9W7JDG5_HIBTR|nr:JAV1- 37 ASSOCIATED UBIQUITIN LIGASE 1 [Hibiscus trionum]